jgi:hypothetical protein
MANTSLNAELAKLRERGMVLPRHTGRAAQAAVSGYDAYRQLQSLATHDLDRASMKLGRTISSDNYDSPEVQRILHENAALSRAMGAKRGLSRQGSMIGRVSSSDT